MKHLGWQIGQLTSLGLNVLLFVPFGYLLPSVTARMNRWWKVLLLGFGFSLLIETVQLITKLGWFDASDLLHNSIGALIGYGIYHRWLREKTT
jgi:glycopeptide antibiotics resistance protein